MTPPLLLVHGFLSTRDAMLPMALQLRRLGLDVDRAWLSTLCIADVRCLAEQVGDSVERVCTRTGSDRVDLLGVSQGGLAALWYLRQLGGHSRVRRMVALGTPFRGTRFAWLGVPLVGLVSKGVWQSLPDSALVQQLAERGPAPGEDVVSITREGDPVAPPDRCLLDGARQVVLPATRFPLVHQTLGFQPLVARTAAAELRR